MNILVLAVGILLTAMGIWSMSAPETTRGLLLRFLDARVYGAAIVIRLAFGLILLLGAQATKIPGAAIALGVMFLLAAGMIPFLGEERIGRIMRWWLDKPLVWLRAWAGLAIALGLFIVWLAV
ncbi:MAG: hypothetical protein QNJ73_02125 [Gammaproteobacteria bacterium]|nr:hypothetical protein [Gammaproteobacteria bacterium]